MLLAIKDLDQVRRLRGMHLVLESLGERVGSPVSYTSIAKDAHLSPNTVCKYIQILEALHIVFRVIPYSQNIARSLLKEPKIYFFDGELVNSDPEVQFKNSMALCLLNYVQIQTENVALHYLRTKERHEVDFAIVNDDQVEMIIEAKQKNHSLARGISYFSEKYGFPAYQVVKELRQERIVQGVQIVRADGFLKRLDL